MNFIPLWLGIDIGGSKLALAVGDEHGRLLAKRRRPSRLTEHAERDLAELADEARALCGEIGLEISALRGVGVSAPGPLDPDGGVLLHPPNLPGWREVPIRRLLGDRLGLPVQVENDANAAALAEWRFGAGRGFQHVAYLTMSTGVGAGLVLGGKLYTGKQGMAGEVGHAPVEWDGEPCACGRRGCLEAYVGGAPGRGVSRARRPPVAAWQRSPARRSGHGPSTWWRRRARGMPSRSRSWIVTTIISRADSRRWSSCSRPRS